MMIKATGVKGVFRVLYYLVNDGKSSRSRELEKPDCS